MSLQIAETMKNSNREMAKALGHNLWNTAGDFLNREGTLHPNGIVSQTKSIILPDGTTLVMSFHANGLPFQAAFIGIVVERDRIELRVSEHNIPELITDTGVDEARPEQIQECAVKLHRLLSPALKTPIVF